MRKSLEIDKLDEKTRKAVFEASPRKSVMDWAKSSCNHCNGSGRTRFKSFGSSDFKDMICSCAENRFRRWLIDFLPKYQLERSKESETLVGTDGQPLKADVPL